MTNEEIAAAEELERIFMPLAHSRRKKMLQEGKLFVHYTSAENAIKILTSGRIWMRNVRCMNDYMEASFGHQQLVRIFQNTRIRDDFINELSKYGDGFGNKIIDHFNKWWNDIQFNTFIVSISEHDQSEDDYGRLSMWRAYGGDSAKAALVLHMPLIPGQVVGLNLFCIPVEYFDYNEIESQFETVIKNIHDNYTVLSKFKPEYVFNMAFFMLVLSALCLKHKGFREEREWRVIYLPSAVPSDTVKQSVEIVGGVPQTIYKIPLEDDAKKQIQGMAIHEILDHIIIGPSVYPKTISEAFSYVLRNAGVQEPRITVSDIPLRT